MKTLTLALTLMMSLTKGFSQTDKSMFKINLLGTGVGYEYFFKPEFSWHNEIGLCFWEKLSDKVEDKDRYKGVSPVNPYIVSSVRYYFSPIHQINNSNTNIGWRASLSYTGHYTGKDFLRLNGRNSHQIGLFAGATFKFSKIWYAEIELGPGYILDDFDKDRFNLFGNAGFGFRF